MSIMKRTSKEDAVSPVVGVMLMLVVTIIIAAVVAAFAGGLGTTTEPADIALLKLTDYKLGTVDQSKTNATELSGTYKDGWYDYGLDTYQSSKSSYGIYSMKFKNMGGDKLFTDDLKLQITYNAASKSLPFKGYVNAKEWAVGDTVTLEITKDMLKDVKFSSYMGKTSIASGWAYGLGQQSMAQDSPSSFTWQILDANNNILAKGTESTKWSSIITVSYSLADDAEKLVTGGKIKVTVKAPTYKDTTAVKLTGSEGLLGGTTTGTITSGKAEITTTVTGAVGVHTVTVEVGTVETTFDVYINPSA